MKKYKVFFELYGRKMQTEVYGRNEEEAREAVLAGISVFLTVDEYRVIKENADPIKDFGDFVKDMKNKMDNLK